MECPGCGRANDRTAAFCGGCGSALTGTCTACGRVNPAGDRFCQGCGSLLGTAEPPRLPAPTGLREGQRRQVTVLFADVVGFTSLSEQLDAEAVHELMDGCFALLTREVERYGGSINAFTGDGVMALFGAPLAEEDHAIRALHAALHIQESLRDYGSTVEQRFRVPFRMRIGVNTGLVVVGGIGDRHGVEFTALGDTINLAARLEGAAPPGGILAGESTWRAAREAFRWRAAGALQLKGKSDPVTAFELLDASESQSRFDTLAQRGLTSLVGRQAELEAVVAAWQRAAAGEGQIVSVVGEAGVGKSRLLHEFKTWMVKREAALFEGSCFTYGEAISYLPFLEIVRGFLGVDATTPEDDAGAVIDRRMAELGLESAAPYVRHVLGLNAGDDRLALQSPTTVRQRTVEALGNLMLSGAAERPMTVVVEDVHWIDEASEEVLSFVVNAMAPSPLLVVLVFRPEYLHAWREMAYHAEVCLDRLGRANSAAMVRAILGKSYARSVALAGLSTDDTRALARQLLGTAAVPKELDAVIETYTDGNPLFIEELVRDLMEAGRLVRGPDGYTFTDAPGSPAIPTTVEGVVLARVDRLQPELRHLLQVASVLGRVFPHRLLEAMTDLDGGLDRLLLQLEDLAFVYQSAVAPERLYSFKHVLTQEAVYQTLVRGRREAYHNLAAQAIESLYGEGADDWVEVLAHHYTRSGNDEKALVYLDLAHRKANRTFAVAQAKEFFDEAMQILDRAPETPANAHHRVTFLANQIQTSLFLGNMRDCFDIAARYEAMADRLDDLALRGRFYERLGQAHEILGCVDEALEKLTAAVAFCTEAGDVAGVGMAHTTLQWTHLWVGNYDGVLRHGATAIRAFEDEFEPLYAMWARAANTYAHAQRGAWNAAIADGEQALRIGEENANDSQIAFSAIMLCIAYTGQGHLDRALEYGELAHQKAPTPAEALWALVALAQTWSRTGRAEQAAQTLAALAPVCEASQFVFVRLWNTTNLGEAYWRAGRLEEARQTLETAVELAGERRFRYLHGSALRLLGEVTRTETHFENSIAALSAIGAENELALAHAGFGRLCLDRGETEEARRHLAQAMNTFERLGTVIDPELGVKPATTSPEGAAAPRPRSRRPCRRR